MRELKGIILLFTPTILLASSAVAPIVLETFMGIFPEKLFRSAKSPRAFQGIYRAVLILFGAQIFYYVLNLIV